MSALGVAIVVGKADRRSVLAGLVVLLAVVNVLTACAPWFWLAIVARALLGIVIGGFWSIGAALAPRRAGACGRCTAATMIFAAVPVGSVLGVPLGTQLGEHAGWRGVRGSRRLGGGVRRGRRARVFPVAGTGGRAVAGARGAPAPLAQHRTAVWVTALIVVAHFAAYTYVTPFLRDAARR
ncbi:MFS transporter [Yinghuangia aomiensis]